MNITNARISKRIMEHEIYLAVAAAHQKFERKTGLTAECISIEMGSIEEVGHPERWALMSVESDVKL